MFPQPVDQANYRYSQDGLLQAYGVVQHDEIHDPQHLDVHGEKCLLVAKNGLTTGTTVGRVIGLESFTHIYDNYGINHTSIDIAVLPTTRRGASFPIPATPGPSSSPGMVASSESSPAVQALPTKPTSRTSPPTGGSSSRSRPSTPTAPSTRSSSRDVASSERLGDVPPPG